MVKPPALTPARPPIALAKLRLLEPTSRVPPAFRKVKPRVERSDWAKPSASWSVPPAKAMPPVVPPMLSSDEMRRVPSLIVVCLPVPPPATLAAESTSVPRPDFVRLALVESGEEMIAVSFGEMAVEVGFWTVMTYSVAPWAPTPSRAMPPPKPDSVVELAEEGVAKGFSVKSITPALRPRVPAPPGPLTTKSEAVEVLLCRTRALTPLPVGNERSAMRASRMFQFVAEGAAAWNWAKVPNS